MESTAVRRRSVLVLGDEESQPQQVVSSVLDSLLSRRGSEVAEPICHAPLSRKRSSCEPRRPSAVPRRHSVLVCGNDGVPTTFNLSAITYEVPPSSNRLSTSSSGSNASSRPAAPHSDVVVVTFSVHSRESFEAAQRTLARAVKRNVARLAGNKSAHSQFLLVGHHASRSEAADDLISTNWDAEDWAPSLWQQRDIYSEEGEQLASQHPNCVYHEVCTDSACTLQDCDSSASLLGDELVSATTALAEKTLSNKIVSKEKALRRWLKATMRPRCVAADQESDDVADAEIISIQSDQTGSMKWWDETASEGASSQWSKLADADSSPLGTPANSLPSSPTRSSSALSVSPLCLIMESF